MRFVVLGCTHGMHERVTVPSGDVLIHTGDFSHDNGRKSMRSFLAWFEYQPHAHKIFIGGNHDGALELWPDLAKAMVKELAPSAIYLQDSGCSIGDINLWGSPVSPSFCNWHFNRDRGEPIKRHWDMIPDKVDILITHGPAYGYLDVSGFDLEHVGCKDLLDAVRRVKPPYHLFSHIHHHYGTCPIGHETGEVTTAINASICDEGYSPTRHPVIFYYDNEKTLQKDSRSD